MDIKGFKADAILSTLKDFQRDTVDYVFDQLYTKGKNRFLIADEMGLGKTLVAKGLIAKTVEHLSPTQERIDIVYICSNHDIAEQNLDRLKISEEKIAHSGRLTLLPLTAKDLDKSPINFISFTPGTSFDLRSRGGKARERALIYRLLREGLGANLKGLSDILKKDVTDSSWKYTCAEVDLEVVNIKLRDAFINDLKKTTLIEDINATRKDDKKNRNILIGHIRAVLAKSCLKALKPDLIILDEFQRFRDLLNKDAEMGQLAEHLFSINTGKTLLLSATPYKMYTMCHEQEGEALEDHYKDFLATSKFLLENSIAATANLKALLGEFRKSIYAIPQEGINKAVENKNAVQDILRGIMVRTERLSTSFDHNGMVDTADVSSTLRPTDLKQFKVLDAAARDVQTYDMVEFWKSVPYAINLMDTSYKFKKELKKAIDTKTLNKETNKTIAANPSALLNWDDIRTYKKVDPANAKLRTLLNNTIEKEAWRLLWIPPAKPYYTMLGGPFDNAKLNGYTKSLVFSAWKAVPKTIAQLCSYAAEQKATEAAGAVDKEYNSVASRPIEFSATEEKLKGLHWFLLMYPCLTLAKLIDPLEIASRLEKDGKIPTHTEVLEEAGRKIQEKLSPILPRHSTAAPSQRSGESHNWNIAALLLLDRKYNPSPLNYWYETDDRDLRWDYMLGAQDEDETGFAEHLDRVWEYGPGDELPPGPPPADLIQTLAIAAIASPAIVALRSFLRFHRGSERNEDIVPAMAAAAKAAIGMRVLFNNRESVNTIRAWEATVTNKSYLQQVLAYSMAGNLQAVMDEYVYALKFHLGLMNSEFSRLVKEIAEEIATAASISTASLRFHELKIKNNTLTFADQERSIRCRFALRFDNEQNEDGTEETRRDLIRKAFNSPFRPFILATTAIGQEGLDFHLYCHHIYHWNLPTNPVDLEQREGRIHRFNGHVIRKNVGKTLPLKAYAGSGHIWEMLFEEACRQRKPEQNEIWPYWIFDIPGGEKIQRFIPALPLSRDTDHFLRLKKTLAAYRMVFGQPRQEDLVSYLIKYVKPEEKDQLSNLCINLEPNN